MKKRGLTKICSLLCLAGLLALAAAAGPCIADDSSFPFVACALRAKLSVNGAAVTTANASSYTIAVTDTSGSPLVDPTTGSTTYGAVVAGRFEYYIPVSINGDTGATIPAAACIEVFYKGTQLYLTYPAQGSCPDGQGEITGLTSGGILGFGGLVGDGSSDTYAKALTAVTPGGPTVDVQCSGSERNSTTAESFGSVYLGQSKNDATCVIRNSAMSTSNLDVTALTMTGCGFSVVSPSSFPVSLDYNETQAMTLAYTPCGVGGVQTGVLTISSNDPVHPSYAVAFTGTGVATLSLTSGWNLIGLPVEPTNPALATVLKGILPKVSVVWAYIDGQWQYYDPSDVAGSALKTLTTWNGYWIYMTSAATLTVN